MNEENNKSEEVTKYIPDSDAKEDKIDDTKVIDSDTNENETDENETDAKNAPTTDRNEDKAETTDDSTIDLSKVKIRHVLMLRIKKCNPNFKKIFAFILIGVVFFCAGLFTDRELIKHKIGGNFYGRPSVQRNMPRNSYGNGKYREYQHNRSQMPKQGKSQQGQTQAPTQDQSQGQSKN